MANVGTIQEFGNSRNGKPFVVVDGQKYYLGKTDMSSASVGDRISFEAKSFGERGDLWGINKYAKLPPASNGVHADAAQPQTRSQPPSTPTNGMSEGERLCVSNWVKGAFEAGLIKSSLDLLHWARASYVAIHEATQQPISERQPGEDDDL